RVCVRGVLSLRSRHHPGPRRHRLYLGARGAPASQTRAPGRGSARRPGVAPRAARRPHRLPCGRNLMDLRFRFAEEAFRREVRAWLEEHLGGAFAPLRGRGGQGDEHALVEERRAWERALAAGGWTGLGWPREHGGRGASLVEQLIFQEEYA